MAKQKDESKGISLSQNLQELTEIATWFDSQQEVDVEQGLEKVRTAAALIKQSKKRLAEIQNEFEEIKKEISEEIPIADEDSPADDNDSIPVISLEDKPTSDDLPF